MAQRTAKKTAIFDFYDPNGPKTLQGKGNKMITGDGRKKVKNLTPEEAADIINTMFGVPKVPGTKKKASSTRKTTKSVEKKRASKK